MKRLFVIFFVTVLTSCGTSLEPPKSNTDYKNIIGKPVKIGNLEIAQYDFPNILNWVDANKACEELGNGWRLPSEQELDYLYQNTVVIGSFMEDYYWSSTMDGFEMAWAQDFKDIDGIRISSAKVEKFHVRAVRSF
jgi:hypothetical protein